MPTRLLSLRFFPTMTVALLAWGVLSFGAVYPWAYRPLLGACAAVGLYGLRRPLSAARVSGPMAAALGAITIAACSQLVPLPQRALASFSPATDALLTQYHLPYAAAVAGTRVPGAADQPRPAHPLSINPGRTARGSAFLLVLATFFLGCARALSVTGANGIARGLVVLGTTVALVGIVQQATFTGKIYGFWQPLDEGNPFGPFVNKNHFAGWMMMVLSTTIGYFCAGVAAGMRGVKPGWRNYVLWFSSTKANELILVAFAATVMALSLVLSMSRSGITCFAIALVLSGWVMTRRQTVGSRRVLTTGYLVFVLCVAIGWVGVDAVGRRFATASWSDMGGRLGPWKDAVAVIEDFPLVGTGLNTYGTATLFYHTSEPTKHFVEAHNDYLQLWAEGGLLVGIPVLITIGLFIREVRQRFRESPAEATTYWLRAGAVIGLVAIAMQEVVEFSLQIPGNAALFAVLAAIAVHKPRVHSAEP